MKWFYLFFMLYQHVGVNGQDTVHAPLRFDGYTRSLCIADENTFIVTSDAGQVAFNNANSKYWRMTKPVKDVSMGIEKRSPLSIKQVIFFNKDTGFVSGSIVGRIDENAIYRTEDAGRTWNAIDIGITGPVNDAIHLANGEVWIGVENNTILYSRDFGKKWKSIRLPKNQSTTSCIFFNPAREGLIGSESNNLIYTTDNCQHWRKLPTPLDQKKYNKTAIRSKPEINHVAIFRDYLLVVQENMVFYSKKDTINWIRLSNYSDCYTEPNNSALFFKSRDGYVKVNKQLEPLHSVREHSYYSYPVCKNGYLFFIQKNEIKKIVGDSSITLSQLYTNNSEYLDAHFMGTSGDTSYGVINNRIYYRRGLNKKWNYFFTFPMNIDSGNLVLAGQNKFAYLKNTDDSLFFYNMPAKTITKLTKASMFKEFYKKGIKKVIYYTTGFEGCSYYEKNEMIYENQGDVFKKTGQQSKGAIQRMPLPDNNLYINASTVIDFVEKIGELVNPGFKPESYKLDFTQQDYDQCRKDILSFQKSLGERKNDIKKQAFEFEENNINFEKLISMVDSIPLYPECIISQNFLSPYHAYWKGVIFVNEENQELKIEAFSPDTHSYLYSWMVSINGLNYKYTNPAINNFFSTTYPTFLKVGDKVAALHTAVINLYRSFQ